MSGLSSRLTVAAHILAFLAWRRGGRATSEEVARSVNTNPVVVRRLLGSMREAGLVEMQPGAAGGALLARPAEEITLLDVYRAVEMDELFSLHPRRPCPDCCVGANIQEVLWPALCRAERAMEAELGQVTVEAIRGEIEMRG